MEIFKDFNITPVADCVVGKTKYFLFEAVREGADVQDRQGVLVADAAGRGLEKEVVIAMYPTFKAAQEVYGKAERESEPSKPIAVVPKDEGTFKDAAATLHLSRIRSKALQGATAEASKAKDVTPDPPT